MNNYVVYMHVTPNGKKYIGITCQRPQQRWANGNGYSKNTYFHKAILKYGWDNIQHIILAENLSKENACDLEKALISGCKTTDPNYGYNMSIGGESGTNGIKFGPEFGQKVRERMLGHRNINYGKKFSEETLQKLSKARKGKWSDRQRIALTKIHERSRKPVICLDDRRIYESLTMAAKQSGVSARGISAVCRGEQISAHGLHWAYYTGQPKEELDKILSDLLYKKEMVYKVRKNWNQGLKYKTGKQKHPCKHKRKRV